MPVQIESEKINVFLVVILLTAFAGIFISKATFGFAFLVIIGVILAALSFLNAEIAIYLLIVSMLLSPQFIAGDPALDPRGRGITLRFDDFIILILGFGWFLRMAVNKELGLFLKTPLNRPIAYYVTICIISTIIGYLMGRVNGASGFFFTMKYFEYFLVYFMVVNHIRDEKQIERFTILMLLVCFVICLIAIYQIPSGGRVSAPFEGKGGEPNTLGGYLVLVLSLVLGLLLADYGSLKTKIFLRVLVFFMLISLSATLSRSSWLALIPMSLALIYFAPKRFTIITSILLLILVAPFVLPAGVKDRVMFTIKQPKEAGQIQVGRSHLDTSTSARIQSLIMVKDDFIKHPFIGYGVTGYPFIDIQYARVLAETGLIGLSSFLILLYLILKNAVHVYRNSTSTFTTGLSLGYLGGFIGMLTHAVGANTFIIVRIMEPFWLLTAMVIMIPRINPNIQS